MYACAKSSMVLIHTTIGELIITVRVRRGEDVVAVVVAAGDGAPAHDGDAAHEKNL